MIKLLSGKPIVDEQTPILKSRASALAKSGALPCLSVIRIGDHQDDIAYENSIERCAGTLGVTLRREVLCSDANASLVSDAIRSLADDTGVHGILVFRPLPEGVDEAAALSAIPPSKDVDGVTAAQMAGLYGMKKYSDASDEIFFPCAAEAVIRVLGHYGIPTCGKRAVVVGRSTVVGKPAAHLLLACDATVTVCHSKTLRLDELTRGADIVVSAAGLASSGRDSRLSAEYLAPGQTVIDVAVNADADGIYGDVDTDAADGIVSAITPVPGGIGSVTTIILMEHVIRAAERSVRSVTGDKDQR